MANYYNEVDGFAAEWLRELIRRDLIAPGEVDERPIEQVEPGDLRGFTQCHFFAGIGVWSHALRAAGWPDDSRVWTGSCPCQGFSASGKRGGFSDKRHLWPAWFRLISQCRPDTIFGEQVASKDGLAWLDVVSADLEASGYAIGSADLCAAGFGAPHIRQRLYFVAESNGLRLSGGRLDNSSHAESSGSESSERSDLRKPVAPRCSIGGLADLSSERCGESGNGRRRSAETGRSGVAGRLAESDRNQHDAERPREAPAVPGVNRANIVSAGESGRAGRLTGGFWRDAEWLWCRDEKYRPVEPGTFPLATGAAKRVGRLRGYGNCLTAPVAQGFIEAYMAETTWGPFALNQGM